ncbi:MAG: hypothetical protein RMK49_13175, partial [Abditibacteriales bacterium]|nr:hypothetical protein [Abditibacteriales bacterium]
MSQEKTAMVGKEKPPVDPGCLPAWEVDELPEASPPPLVAQQRFLEDGDQRPVAGKVGGRGGGARLHVRGCEVEAGERLARARHA